MVKRSRGDGTLTGGLGDVNPAFLSTTVTQTGADTTTTQTVQTPVTIIAGRDESIIMEIIKVLFYFDDIPGFSATTSYITAYLSTKNFGTTQPALRQGDAQVFASANLTTTTILLTSAGAVEWGVAQPIKVDLTDGAGHGFLVATNNIYLQCASSNDALQANIVRVKILYRLKKVNQAQLNAIILSQNQG